MEAGGARFGAPGGCGGVRAGVSRGPRAHSRLCRRPRAPPGSHDSGLPFGPSQWGGAAGSPTWPEQSAAPPPPSAPRRPRRPEKMSPEAVPLAPHFRPEPPSPRRALERPLRREGRRGAGGPNRAGDGQRPLAIAASRSSRCGEPRARRPGLQPRARGARLGSGVEGGAGGTRAFSGGAPYKFVRCTLQPPAGRAARDPAPLPRCPPLQSHSVMCACPSPGLGRTRAAR